MNITLSEGCYLVDAHRKDQSSILLCSDLATRGLDIPTTSHVIQVNSIVIYSNLSSSTNNIF